MMDPAYLVDIVLRAVTLLLLAGVVGWAQWTMVSKNYHRAPDYGSAKACGVLMVAILGLSLIVCVDPYGAYKLLPRNFVLFVSRLILILTWQLLMHSLMHLLQAQFNLEVATTQLNVPASSTRRIEYFIHGNTLLLILVGLLSEILINVAKGELNVRLLDVGVRLYLAVISIHSLGFVCMLSYMLRSVYIRLETAITPFRLEATQVSTVVDEDGVTSTIISSNHELSTPAAAGAILSATAAVDVLTKINRFRRSFYIKVGAFWLAYVAVLCITLPWIFSPRYDLKAPYLLCKDLTENSMIGDWDHCAYPNYNNAQHNLPFKFVDTTIMRFFFPVVLPLVLALLTTKISSTASKYAVVDRLDTEKEQDFQRRQDLELANNNTHDAKHCPDAPADDIEAAAAVKSPKPCTHRMLKQQQQQALEDQLKSPTLPPLYTTQHIDGEQDPLNDIPMSTSDPFEQEQLPGALFVTVVMEANSGEVSVQELRSPFHQSAASPLLLSPLQSPIRSGSVSRRNGRSRAMSDRMSISEMSVTSSHTYRVDNTNRMLPLEDETEDNTVDTAPRASAPT